MKTGGPLVGDQVIKSERCCGESARWGHPARHFTQIRFRKEEELRKAKPRCAAMARWRPMGDVKILTSCPSCLGLVPLRQRPEGWFAGGRLHRGRDGAADPQAGLDAAIRGGGNAGGIERVLV